MGATQTEAPQPEDALEVGEQHFDALTVATRLLKGLGLAERTSDIAGILVDAARDLARWLLRAASQLQRAHIAIAFARPIQQLLVIDDLAGGGEDLASRADIDVALLIECEVLPREGTVLALRLVDHRDVWRDFLVVDQPVEVWP